LGHVDLIHVDLVQSIRRSFDLSQSIWFMPIWSTQFNSMIMVEDELANGRRNMPWMLTVARQLQFRCIVLHFSRFGCNGSDGNVFPIFNNVSKVLRVAV